MGRDRRRDRRRDVGWSGRFRAADARLTLCRRRPGDLCVPDRPASRGCHAGSGGQHDGTTRRHIAPEPSGWSGQRRRAVSAHLRRVCHRTGPASGEPRLHSQYRRPSGAEPMADTSSSAQARTTCRRGWCSCPIRSSRKRKPTSPRSGARRQHAPPPVRRRTRRLRAVGPRPLPRARTAAAELRSPRRFPLRAQPVRPPPRRLRRRGAAAATGSPAKGSSGLPLALSLAAFETVSPAAWALPLLGVLVLVLLLPGLILLASGRSLTEALGGLRSPPNPPVAQPSDPAMQSSGDGGAEP